MILRLIFAALVFAIAPVSADQVTRDPGTHFFNETFGNFAEELETAGYRAKWAFCSCSRWTSARSVTT